MNQTLPHSLKDGFRRWWPTLAFFIVLLFLLKPVWLDGKVLGFRDALHFYYPFWTYLESLPAAERLMPRWNPLDAFGSSIIGEPTSMVFYPFRFLLHLAFGSIEQRIGWFSVFHLALAYSSWVAIGLRFRFSALITQLSGFGYALSGPVFFQIYNPPFLVGAAWLPTAMAGILAIVARRDLQRFHRERDRSRIFSRDVGITGLGVSMMILGGDAQSAYHVALLSLILAAASAVRLAFLRVTPQEFIRQSTLPMLRLVLAFLLAAGLSAVQILPTCYWLRHSERIEATSTTALDAPPSALHVSINRYDFSHPPWHFATLISPNGLGSFTPVHTRWAQLIPGDGRVWTPSLHVGLLVVLLAIQQWICNSRNVLARATLLVAAIAFLSCMGRSGLYDGWTTWLPLYDYFRYPAKWTSLFAWSICMAANVTCQGDQPPAPAAGQSNDRCDLTSSRAGTALARAFGVIGCCGSSILIIHLAMVFVPAATQRTYEFLGALAEDPWCGPIDRQLVIRNLGQTGLTMLMAGFSSLWLLRKSSNGRHPTRNWIVDALVAVCIVELTIAAHASISPIDRRCLTDIAGFSEVGDRDPFAATIETWRFGDFQQSVATATTVGLPPAPSQPSSDPTFAPRATSNSSAAPEILAAHQTRALLGKLHLLNGIRSFHAQFTFRPRMIASARDRSSLPYWHHRILPRDDYESPFNQASTNRKPIEFRNVSMAGHHIAFDYTLDETAVLELPVFDDGGWFTRQPGDSGSAMVPNASQLVTMRLAPGKGSVRLEYWPPGLSVGMAVSGMTIGLSMIVYWVRRKGVRHP